MLRRRLRQFDLLAPGVLGIAQHDLALSAHGFKPAVDRRRRTEILPLHHVAHGQAQFILVGKGDKREDALFERGQVKNLGDLPGTLAVIYTVKFMLTFFPRAATPGQR